MRITGLGGTMMVNTSLALQFQEPGRAVPENLGFPLAVGQVSILRETQSSGKCGAWFLLLRVVSSGFCEQGSKLPPSSMHSICLKGTLLYSPVVGKTVWEAHRGEGEGSCSLGMC